MNDRELLSDQNNSSEITMKAMNGYPDRKIKEIRNNFRSPAMGNPRQR